MADIIHIQWTPNKLPTLHDHATKLAHVLFNATSRAPVVDNQRISFTTTTKCVAAAMTKTKIEIYIVLNGVFFDEKCIQMAAANTSTKTNRREWHTVRAKNWSF